ncbi:MAG: transposase [Acidobacteriota bacterium]
MLWAIAAAKKKNDRIDANKIGDCLRCDFLLECYMAPTAIRERRRTLRYRNLLVRQVVQLKNKIAVLLMEAGVSYNKQRLHKVGYFRELLATNPDINDGLRSLLGLCRETMVRLAKTESALVRSLERDPLLAGRVEGQRQSRDAGRSAEARGLPGGRRSPATGVSGHRNRKPDRRLRRGGQIEFLRRVACHVPPFSRLGQRAQAPDAPFEKFRGWQVSTNSIFCAAPLVG